MDISYIISIPMIERINTDTRSAWKKPGIEELPQGAPWGWIQDRLERELCRHIDIPPRCEHLGITASIGTVTRVIQLLGVRIVGIHESCVSGEFHVRGNPLSIACIVFRESTQEFHLAYVGNGADCLDYVANVINQELERNALETYQWEDKLFGKSAHL